MILFNTTFVVENSLKANFLLWVSKVLLPAAAESGLLTDPLVSRILQPDDDPCEAESFAVQFKSESLETAKVWRDSVFPELFHLISKENPQSILPFSTFMEII